MKIGTMNRLAALWIGVSALLAAAVPLPAQTPDPHHIYAYPPIQRTNGPQNSDTPIGIVPVQFRAAYGFNRIANQGQGQTIALVDAYDDPNIASDLAVYQAEFHLAPCNFQKVEIGNPAASDYWALEISLDVEQACALAPQANIVLVEATTDSFADLLAAVQLASSAPYNATVVSMSWGGDEFNGEQGYDSFFCNIVAGNGQPVTFVAASGDVGHSLTLYPSTSPCVIAAGGTTLVLSTAAPLSSPLQLDYGAETAWFDSGGGVSPYEPQPSFQDPACATWSTSNRCVPDVSSDANPATGVAVYDTYDDSGWIRVGGTSLATPDWASLFTLVNSQRAAQGKGTLSQAHQDLYTIYYSSNYLTDFHDITSGDNGNCGSECDAGPGYDLVTGIGTYQANNLAPALVADPN